MQPRQMGFISVVTKVFEWVPDLHTMLWLDNKCVINYKAKALKAFSLG